MKAEDVCLYLETATRAHPLTLRRASIEYRRAAVRNGEPTALLEAIVTVSNERDSPQVTIEAAARPDLEQFLVPLRPSEERRQGHAH
jgi:hypothetical protein